VREALSKVKVSCLQDEQDDLLFVKPQEAKKRPRIEKGASCASLADTNHFFVSAVKRKSREDAMAVMDGLMQFQPKALDGPLHHWRKSTVKVLKGFKDCIRECHGGIKDAFFALDTKFNSTKYKCSCKN